LFGRIEPGLMPREHFGDQLLETLPAYHFCCPASLANTSAISSLKPCPLSIFSARLQPFLQGARGTTGFIIKKKYMQTSFLPLCEYSDSPPCSKRHKPPARQGTSNDMTNENVSRETFHVLLRIFDDLAIAEAFFGRASR
jgi:hypothetical protein